MKTKLTLWLFSVAMVAILGCEQPVNTVVQGPDDPDIELIDVDDYEREMANATGEKKKKLD